MDSNSLKYKQLESDYKTTLTMKTTENIMDQCKNQKYNQLNLTYLNSNPLWNKQYGVANNKWSAR